MEEKSKKIVFHIKSSDGGNSFVYGGSKTYDELVAHFRWETPCHCNFLKDDGKYICFHSANLEYFEEV